jgi:hypothetical protein
MWLSAAASSLRSSRRAMGHPRSIPFASKLKPARLINYGADNLQMYRHVRCDTGQILRGAKPADLRSCSLPNSSSSSTCRRLGPLSLDVPPTLVVRWSQAIRVACCKHESDTAVEFRGGEVPGPLLAHRVISPLRINSCPAWATRVSHAVRLRRGQARGT